MPFCLANVFNSLPVKDLELCKECSCLTKRSILCWLILLYCSSDNFSCSSCSFDAARSSIVTLIWCPSLALIHSMYSLELHEHHRSYSNTHQYLISTLILIHERCKDLFIILLIHTQLPSLRKSFTSRDSNAIV